ncbi:fimbrial protein [Bacteroides sp.]|uniref:DUF4906 domain-containing protein n=1 Tax=Bacteroides sp. TaxID=29523 RepID=UPI0025BC06D6|nr:fimbrial protein [Bacteroides sp.]
MAVLFFACTENKFTETIVGDNPEEELEEVALELKSLPVEVVGEAWKSASDTRAADISNVDENAINNIWVFQYNGAGTLISAPRYYATTSTSGTAALKVMLRPASNCQIYIVANTNDVTWASGITVNSNLSILTSKTFTRFTENAMYGGANKNLLMSAHVTGKTITAGISNSLSTISLKRMVAKISFFYKIAAGVTGLLKVNKIAIGNVPNVLKIGETTTASYPVSLTPCVISDVISPTESTVYSCFIPENWQGTTSNTDPKTKNDAAPANAVYIRLYIDSDVDGSSYVYTVYPGENTTNDFNIKRNCQYNITLNLNSSATDNRVMAAPANCFVMTPQSSIIFDPYDRTETGGGWKYSDYVNKNVAAKKISSVKILWQTGDGANFAIGNNSGGNLVSLKDDKIYVTAGALNGNAVIAGYNSSGAIVWSWHIWVNNSSPAKVENAVLYNTYNWDSGAIYNTQRVAGRSFMSCNLGAVSTVQGDIGAVGNYYQWGRKDPFPTIKVYDGTFHPYNSTYVVNVYGNNANLLPMSSTVGAAAETFSTVKTDVATGTLEYAIQHPTTFMASTDPGIWDVNPQGETPTHTPANYVNNGNWYWGVNPDRLWGGRSFDDPVNTVLVVSGEKIVANNGAETKSIFDPCPSGWMLPPSDVWMGFTIDGMNHSGDYTSNTQNYSNYGTEGTDRGLVLYMQQFKSGITSFFPFCGWRNADGSCYVMGGCGGYYTSAASRENASSIFHIHPNLVHPYDYGYGYSRRACAYPIRCVREVKG